MQAGHRWKEGRDKKLCDEKLLGKDELLVRLDNAVSANIDSNKEIKGSSSQSKP